MNYNRLYFSFLITLAISACFSIPTHAHGVTRDGGDRIKLSFLSRYHAGDYGQGAVEIVSFDPVGQLAFITNGFTNSVDAISLAKLESPLLSFSIDLSKYGNPNSVAVKNGLVAVAVENKNPQANGSIVIFNTKGEFLNEFTTGAMPDMVTFSPNAKHILAANEGEPNDSYTIDPEGSITIIDLIGDVRRLTQKNVRLVTFNEFQKDTLDSSVRITGKNASVAQDLEPEYISVSTDSKTAWVSLQENNALAEISIELGQVKKIMGLGTLSHNNTKTGIDASDMDNGINIHAWPVSGLFQPDTIANYQVGNETYIVTANEGDSRDYSGFSDEVRVGQLSLEGTPFINFKAKEKLGRLKVSKTDTDLNNDGKVDQLLSFGTRSFSIWNSDGMRVYDSGSQFARITARDYPKLFNDGDMRSDNKGSEPEALTIGKIDQATYAFIGLERTGGIMVYNISSPKKSFFVDYLNTISPQLPLKDSKAGDRAPESIAFVSASDSPNGQPFIITANEVSGTLALYKISKATAKHH
jgi:hypothetical protein